MPAKSKLIQESVMLNFFFIWVKKPLGSIYAVNMLLKFFFILVLSLAGWTAAGDGEDQKTAKYYEEMMSQREALLNRAKGEWDFCRSQCRSKYTKAGRAYNNQECDIEHCSSKRAKYNELDKDLKRMKEAQKKAKDREGQKAGNDPLSQVKKQKKDTGLYAVMGVGTTVFLGYKAKTCCAQCTGSNPSCCGMCPVWVGMTGLAGAQTMKMFKKKKDLGKTVRDLCTSTKPGDCDTDDDGDNEKTPPEFTAPFCSDNPDKCLPIYNMMNEGCLPSDPDYPECDGGKDKKTQLNMQGPPGPGGFSELTGDEHNPKNTDPASLFTDLANNFGWPDDIENPFSPTNTKPFDYNTLPPHKKKMADNIMADINKQNKDYMDKMGLGAGSDFEDDDLSEGGVGSGTGALKGAVSANFPVKADNGSRSLAGNDNQKRGKKKKANSIADQMKAMLAKMNGMGGSQANGAGHLGDKSVLIGNDNVGVREDNIFMMVHRMNRKLEGNSRFINF